jgi:hypothetical protein
MGVRAQHIRGFSPGSAFQIHRKVVNPGKPDPIISVTLQIIDNYGRELLSREVKRYAPRDTSVPDEGLIIHSGDREPFVVDFKINLFSSETYILSGNPHYNIRLNTATHLYNVETGLFTSGDYSVQVESPESPMIIPDLDVAAWDESGLSSEVVTLSPPPPSLLPPPPSLLTPPALPLPIPGDPGYPPPCVEIPEIPSCVDHSYSTYADACVTVGGRAALIIDGFLDAILGDYRQLRVWDEHARRTANDPLKLRLTYEYLNQYTTPEIYDGQNKEVDFNLVNFDFRNGLFSVADDDGNQDYFVTYTFNFFPETILRMYMQQTVLIMNFVGAGAGGGYLTNYTTLEETPASWDGLIALGAAALAWKRLATNGVLWRNFLIFDGDVGEGGSSGGGIQSPGGAAAMQAANDASTYYQGLFDAYAAATKFDRFVIPPTEYWQVFSTTGFGSYGHMGVGTGNQIWEGKFRGLTVNKSFSY